MLIDKANYKRCFSGFTLTGCAVRSREIFYFITLSEDDSDGPDCDRLTRVNVCFAAKPMEERWRLITYRGMSRFQATVAPLPIVQLVGADLGGQVASFGSGTKAHESPIPCGPQGPIRGGVRRLRTIEGKVHVSSGYRGLARRDGISEWVSLCDKLEFVPTDGPSVYGFEDFDAFSADDIYCAGGKGDVWHRSDKGWTQLDFPSKQGLSAVCCGGDGFVYIGGDGGSVWKGRNNDWRLIHSDNMTLPFNDMVWYLDRVYCTSDYGLWEIKGDRLSQASVPDDIKVCSGNLDVADGVMLLAGVYGAALLEGNVWKHIYDSFTFSGKPGR